MSTKRNIQVSGSHASKSGSTTHESLPSGVGLDSNQKRSSPIPIVAATSATDPLKNSNSELLESLEQFIGVPSEEGGPSRDELKTFLNLKSQHNLKDTLEQLKLRQQDNQQLSTSDPNYNPNYNQKLQEVQQLIDANGGKFQLGASALMPAGDMSMQPKGEKFSINSSAASQGTTTTRADSHSTQAISTIDKSLETLEAIPSKTATMESLESTGSGSTNGSAMSGNGTKGQRGAKHRKISFADDLEQEQGTGVIEQQPPSSMGQIPQSWPEIDPMFSAPNLRVEDLPLPNQSPVVPPAQQEMYTGDTSSFPLGSALMPAPAAPSAPSGSRGASSRPNHLKQAGQKFGDEVEAQVSQTSGLRHRSNAGRMVPQAECKGGGDQRGECLEEGNLNHNGAGVAPMPMDVDQDNINSQHTTPMDLDQMSFLQVSKILKTKSGRGHVSKTGQVDRKHQLHKYLTAEQQLRQQLQQSDQQQEEVYNPDDPNHPEANYFEAVDTDGPSLFEGFDDKFPSQPFPKSYSSFMQIPGTEEVLFDANDNDNEIAGCCFGLTFLDLRLNPRTLNISKK